MLDFKKHMECEMDDVRVVIREYKVDGGFLGGAYCTKCGQIFTPEEVAKYFIPEENGAYVLQDV